jgi:hypothetical protein
MPKRRLPMVKRIDALEEKLDFLLNTVSLSRVVESPTGPVQAKATLGEIFESFRNKGVAHEPQDTTAGLAGNIPAATGASVGDQAVKGRDQKSGGTTHQPSPEDEADTAAYLQSVRAELAANRK